MGWKAKGFAGVAALAGISFTTLSAQAIEPLPEGTLAVSAERLVSSNLEFFPGGGPVWVNQFFGAAQGSTPFGKPRLGIDYFIIDGLSLGGHVGFGFNTRRNNDMQGYFALLPRVGYAFSLSQSIDFWPRVGGGFVVQDGGGDTGVLTAEAMFLWNLKDFFALEFGPALDIPFSDNWNDAVLGANAGMVVSF